MISKITKLKLSITTSPQWDGTLLQQIEYKLRNQITRYVACCKHQTTRCYLIAIDVQSFISLVFKQYYKSRPQNVEPFGYKGWGLKKEQDEYRLTLPNSIVCFLLVSGCCFFCQNIFILSVEVANNLTISQYFYQRI